jgi:hypothetical protein
MPRSVAKTAGFVCAHGLIYLLEIFKTAAFSQNSAMPCGFSQTSRPQTPMLPFFSTADSPPFQ